MEGFLQPVNLLFFLLIAVIVAGIILFRRKKKWLQLHSIPSKAPLYHYLLEGLLLKREVSH